MDQIGIFISYAHEDKQFVDELLNRLRHLERRIPSVYIWSDLDIFPGQSQSLAIREHLEDAKIILLFISANFLVTKYDELAQIEEKHKAGGAIIMPILVRPTVWSDTFLANIKALPSNNRPLSTWKSPNMAYLEIVDEIESVIDDYLSDHKLSSGGDLPKE